MSQQSIHAETFIPEWTFADRLRKARQATGLLQREFAEKLGVSKAAYAQWEAGNSRPRDVVIFSKKIELITNIPASWMLGLETQNPRPGGPGEGEVWAPRGSNPQPTD